mmetsp:Transcript_15405/g.42620  ORF Transcript_15405/g.42620 Transcript_15405/m.42620 type:complete len:111 (-) Transcript_15405:56-388(-)
MLLRQQEQVGAFDVIMVGEIDAINVPTAALVCLCHGACNNNDIPDAYPSNTAGAEVEHWYYTRPYYTYTTRGSKCVLQTTLARECSQVLYHTSRQSRIRTQCWPWLGGFD